MKGPIILTLLVAAPKSHPEVTLPIFHLTLPFNHKAPRTACRGRGGRDAGRRAVQPNERGDVAESAALPLPTLPPSNGLPPDETSAFFSSFAPSDGTIARVTVVAAAVVVAAARAVDVAGETVRRLLHGRLERGSVSG